MQTHPVSDGRSFGPRIADEAGVALITALLVLMLMSAMMVGMFAALAASQRADVYDRDQTQAYAAAHAGLEKLTSSTASLFAVDWSPIKSQIDNLMTTPPVIPGFAFTAPGGAAGSGYAVIPRKVDAKGNPVAEPADITTGPFTGLKGIITPYDITVTAASRGGAEVRLRREIQTVAVPVLQFGVFSDSDLTFYAGDDFNFGGRVHTNKSLFVCQFAGKMTFSDRITAFEEVARNYFSNGLSATSNGCTGQVLIPTSAATNRPLTQNPVEGSVIGMPGPGQQANTKWQDISTNTYKSWITNSDTGAKKLDLPLVSQGALPIDIIRRPTLISGPKGDESVNNAPVYGQRYYAQASLRILLSDRAADITGLPTITGAAPIALSGNWLPGQAPPAGYTVGATTPPIALSIGPIAATTSGTASGGTITVSSIPAGFKIPLTLMVGTQSVRCTGTTASTFTGCTKDGGGSIANIAASTAISATLASGATVSTRTHTSSITGGSGITITTVANGTIPFSPSTFWIDGVLWQCTGYTTTPSFTSCTNTQSVNINTVTNGKSMTTSALSNGGQPLIGGFIKIEKQNAAGNWSDVTAEILSLGIGAVNQEGYICDDPTPLAVIRIQRLRDNGATATPCSYNSSTNPYDWWPNTLYDAREGNFRTVGTGAQMNMGGVMQYISLDVANLKKWFAGTTGTTGSTAWNNNGYIVYFSDRRGDHNEFDGDKESAQYAFEDQVNPNSSIGAPDSTLQTGEDMNGNAVQDVWGKTPSGVAGVVPTGGNTPYSSSGTPDSDIDKINAGIVRVNKVVLFRRALKLVRGDSGNLPTSGLTVASENPVYVQGNYNATSALEWDKNEIHVPALIVADAITLLSNNWRDLQSFLTPNDREKRDATTTGYRFGAVAGKGLSFPHCGGNCGGTAERLFGTDGGAGNFLRLLEDWTGVSVNYRGSLISLFISNQATGTFKYNVNVYDYADRNFSFDEDFLQPQLLPPGTPMFRDINTLKFRQILRPNQ